MVDKKSGMDFFGLINTLLEVTDDKRLYDRLYC